MIAKQRRLLTYNSPDGFEINALLTTPEFQSEQEMCKQPIIINVHGVLGNFLARGTPQILPPMLLERGISTLSINTRMGFLGQIFGEGIYHEAGQDIAESVNLLTEHGFENIYVLGYSLGANLAVHYLTQSGGAAVKGVILEGCSYSLPDSQKRRLAKFGSIPQYEDIYERARQILGPDPGSSRNDQLFIVYKAWGDSYGPVDIEIFSYRTWWFMRSPEADSAKTYKHISKVKVPVLFIHGENDDIVDHWEPEKLKEILNESGNYNVILKYIPDARHDCMENPKTTTDVITSWLYAGGTYA